MSDLIMLSKAQIRRTKPYFPLSHGVSKVDDQPILSAIIFVIRNGLRWRDAWAAYGPHKTIDNRVVHWNVFNKIFAALAATSDADDIGHTKGGLDWKLHAVYDGNGRPVILRLTERQASDHIGAKHYIRHFQSMPPA